MSAQVATRSKDLVTKRSRHSIHNMDDESKTQDFATPQPSPASHREHQRNDSGMIHKASPYAEHGALIDRTSTADERTQKVSYNAGLMWPRIREYCRKPFAEFMGTFILVMFGDGVVAQVTLSKDQGGDYQSISWGWVCHRT